MTEPNMHDLQRRQDQNTAAMERLVQSLDRLSIRIDALPDTIDRTYVRKDVALERATRVDAAFAALAASQREHADETQEKFDRLAITVRWAIAGILVPVVLAIFAILNAKGQV